MRSVRIAAAVPMLLLVAASPGAFAGDQAAAPQITADRIALVLNRMHAPAVSSIVRTAGSCTTSCGPDPEGSCSKSCKDGESCSATCNGGKAVCRCD